MHDGGLGAHDPAQQRTPWERDGHVVGATVELMWQSLDRGDHEQGVRQLCAQRRARAITQAVDAGIERDRERVPLASRDVQRGVAIARAHVHDDAMARRDQPVDLTDVHLGQTAPDEDAHGPKW